MEVIVMENIYLKFPTMEDKQEWLDYVKETKEDNPVLIYLPEIEFDTFEFIQDVKEALEKKNNVRHCSTAGTVGSMRLRKKEYGNT